MRARNETHRSEIRQVFASLKSCCCEIPAPASLCFALRASLEMLLLAAVSTTPRGNTNARPLPRIWRDHNGGAVRSLREAAAVQHASVISRMLIVEVALIAAPASAQYNVDWGDDHGHTSYSDGKGNRLSNPNASRLTRFSSATFNSGNNTCEYFRPSYSAWTTSAFAHRPFANSGGSSKHLK